MAVMYYFERFSPLPGPLSGGESPNPGEFSPDKT